MNYRSTLATLLITIDLIRRCGVSFSDKSGTRYWPATGKFQEEMGAGVEKLRFLGKNFLRFICM